SCRLDVSDDLPADDRAWLVREGSSPKVEPHASLSAELARVAEVYQRSRPAGEGSARLMLVRETAQLPARERGVIAAAGNETIAPKPVRVEPHRVTAHVNWDALPGPLRIAGDPPAGWSPLVSVAGRVLVAARPEEPRQVWVGFDAPEWARTTDFVIFWTNVFDWAGGGGASFVAHPLSEWSPEWTPVEPIPAPAGMWPGLYRRSDGALRAFAAPGVKMSSPVRTDWASRLSAVPVTVGRLDLSGVLLALAVGCVALSAGVWRRARQAARIPEIDTGGRSRASA
ncbi:MAG TPA: hypothetical protein VLJ39_08075, partial [Tepidisphaeraceae bacterium]|nr:hypothetical protein [Tepidisphaeraceae bacterium]